MTQDAIYDNSALPGVLVMKGLEEIKKQSPTQYTRILEIRRDWCSCSLIFSKWKRAVLYDSNKTSKNYEKCDDIMGFGSGFVKIEV